MYITYDIIIFTYKIENKTRVHILHNERIAYIQLYVMEMCLQLSVLIRIFVQLRTFQYLSSNENATTLLSITFPRETLI